MVRAIGSTLVLATLALSSSASAWIYIGTPELNVWVDRTAGDISAADAFVNQVRVHKCSGGFDGYTIAATVDLVEGFTVPIEGGDICGVSVDWEGSVEVSNGTWAINYDEDYTSVQTDGAGEHSIALTPFNVETPPFAGKAPRLIVHIE